MGWPPLAGRVGGSPAEGGRGVSGDSSPSGEGGAYSAGRIFFLQVSPCQGRRQRCVGGELTGYTGERKRKEREAEPRYLEMEMGTQERGGTGREETGHTRGDGKRRRDTERHRDPETVERDRDTHRDGERGRQRNLGLEGQRGEDTDQTQEGRGWE